MRRNIDVIINADRALAPEGCVPIAAATHAIHNFLSSVGYAVDQPPVADLLRCYHGLDGVWCVLSPIYWLATHNDAMIVACGDTLDLPEIESKLWFDALSKWLEQDDIKLHYHDAHTWLIQAPACSSINAKPVHALLQQSILTHLKTLDETGFWPRFITENQMFFSQHALNETRKGRYPINGVWVWGAGQLRAPSLQSIICGDDYAYQLATIVSKNASHFQQVSPLPKQSVLLFLETTDVNTLATRLKKYTVRWYWNNLAYVIRPKCWFARLWR